MYKFTYHIKQRFINLNEMLLFYVYKIQPIDYNADLILIA